MPAVKYWKVCLFSDAGAKAATSIVSGLSREPIPESPFFIGYSLAMPKFNVSDDNFIELHVSADFVGVHSVRRFLIGSVRVTPVYIDTTGEKTDPAGNDCDKAADDKPLVPAGFEEAARPLMKWMAENLHPHHTAIVDQSSAELSSGLQRVTTSDYILD